MKKGTNYMLDDAASGKKLLGGIFRVASVCLLYTYLGDNWVFDVRKSIVSFLSDNPNSAGANFIATLSTAIVGVWGLYWFVLGIYKIYTFSMYIDAYETKLTPFQKAYMKDSVSSTSNIEATMRYRDGKMRTMTPEQAAEFYLDTNRVINSTTNKSVIGYINSKMTIMTPDQRINFLRGKK